MEAGARRPSSWLGDPGGGIAARPNPWGNNLARSQFKIAVTKDTGASAIKLFGSLDPKLDLSGSSILFHRERKAPRARIQSGGPGALFPKSLWRRGGVSQNHEGPASSWLDGASFIRD